MKLPWARREPATENYQDTSYTDALIAALIRQARGRRRELPYNERDGRTGKRSGPCGARFHGLRSDGR